MLSIGGAVLKGTETLGVDGTTSVSGVVAGVVVATNSSRTVVDGVVVASRGGISMRAGMVLVASSVVAKSDVSVLTVRPLKKRVPTATKASRTRRCGIRVSVYFICTQYNKRICSIFNLKDWLGTKKTGRGATGLGLQYSHKPFSLSS